MAAQSSLSMTQSPQLRQIFDLHDKFIKPENPAALNQDFLEQSLLELFNFNEQVQAFFSANMKIDSAKYSTIKEKIMAPEIESLPIFFKEKFPALVLSESMPQQIQRAWDEHFQKLQGEVFSWILAITEHHHLIINLLT